MADIALSGALALVEILSPILSQEFNLERNVQSDISAITRCLHTMKAFLADNEGDERTEVARDQVRQIRDFAYYIEYIIDDFMYQVPHHFHRHRVTQIAHNWRHFPRKRIVLHNLSSRIQDVKKEMDSFMKMHQLRVGGTGSGEASSSNRPMTSPSHRTVEHDEVVGFQSLVEQIRNQLLPEGPRRLTVYIVGPAGSGKTTLAEKIVEDQKARGVFSFISLVKVSPSLNPEDLLRRVEMRLLEQVENDHPSLIQQTRISTRAVLWRHLEDRKYLIVLDDVWETQDLELILGRLPEGLASRVIVTSRKREVASFRIHDRFHLHELSGLSWKDAWNLFCKKAFWPICECPPELEEWAEKIVKKCEGLPLALATVGGLLSNKQKIPVEWKKFHDSIGTDLSIAGSLLPSYNDLRAQPDLKSCFLYFGIFPEDYCIQRERLFRLWIAEGFVKEERNRRRVDEVAERNLDDLINWSLVSVSERDIDGRVRSCRVLNLVREFIISKAEEENFVSVFTGQSSPPSEKVRRLSLIDPPTFSPDKNVDRARSAFNFGKANLLPFIAQFKLLRVLDMKGAPLKSFPKEILRLCLLRYLSLQHTQIRSIPRFIEKLSHLETLDLKQTLITQLPDTIFKLQHLRHLLVYRYEFDNYVPFQA